MYYNRKQLKAIKKDITEQLNANITIDNLYIPNFITYGDDIYISREEKIYFDGKLTKQEIYNYDNTNDYRVYNMSEITIIILENENIKDVEISVKCQLIDKWDNITDWEYISLNIL